MPRFPWAIIAISTAISLAGCSNMPDKANIQLRKQIQSMQANIDQLNHQHDADEATIRGLESSATTVPTLPPDEIDQLVTASGFRFGKVTGGWRADPNAPADTELKVFVVPTDEQGDDLKAAGSWHVELFDLNLKDPRIGQWDFDPATAKNAWVGTFLVYMYALDCPWQTAPTHEKLLVRVTYTDLLTHRVFTEDYDHAMVKIAQ